MSCVCLHAGAPAWAHKGTKAHLTSVPLDSSPTAPTTPVSRGFGQTAKSYFTWGKRGAANSPKTLEYEQRKQERNAAQK